MNTILLVEDDPILGRGLSLNLEIEGFHVRWVKDLSSATAESNAHRFELMLLDLALPDGTGLSFLKQVRDAGSSTPIIVLTAKTDEDSVVEGLQLGANDYVRKPFGDRELIARIRTALRDPLPQDRQLKFVDLVLHLDRRLLMVGEQKIELSPREFDILRYFLENPERVVSREALLKLFDASDQIIDRTVDSHVSHVRTRLRKAGVASVQINSVYGVGYRLEKA